MKLYIDKKIGRLFTISAKYVQWSINVDTSVSSITSLSTLCYNDIHGQKMIKKTSRYIILLLCLRHYI